MGERDLDPGRARRIPPLLIPIVMCIELKAPYYQWSCLFTGTAEGVCGRKIWETLSQASWELTQLYLVTVLIVFTHTKVQAIIENLTQTYQKG